MKIPHVPHSKCSQCQLLKPAYGFTIVSSDSGAPSRELCGFCFSEAQLGCGHLTREEMELSPLSITDSFGKEHIFYFDVRWTSGLGIRAFELVDGNPGGYQFAIMDHPAAEVSEAYVDLVEKIKSGIAIHYLESSDFESGHDRLYIQGSAINGRIEEKGSTPSVVVDGREYSWEQFGSFLSSYTGFNFRLECFDPYESIEINPRPQYPDSLWWLDGGGAQKAEADSRRFQ